jgi:hypothetical protein
VNAEPKLPKCLSSRLRTDRYSAEIVGQKNETAGREIISVRERCFKETGNAANVAHLSPSCRSSLRATLLFSVENVGQKKEQKDNRFETNKNPASAGWRNRGVFILGGQKFDIINFMFYNNQAL